MSRTRANNQSGGIVAITSLAVILALIMLVGLVFANRQLVTDWIAVQSYRPSTQIANIVSDTGMSQLGKFYFYASQPEITEAQVFNQHCNHRESGSAILGCYVGHRIYIYNVTNAELHGIKGVTAAHEMMHAAFDRLSKDEQSQVERMIENEYAAKKEDPDLAERVALYEKLEPGQRDKELYAIFATESREVGDDLEHHYDRYFEERGRVVTMYEKYSGVFKRLDQRAKELVNTLKSLESEIVEQKQRYQAESYQLSADISRFNNRAEDGGFVGQSQFNSERAQLISRSDQLDVLRDEVNTKIADYDRYREELEAISTHVEELNSSINSKLAPAPNV